METINKKTIGEYVADDFRTAAVFSKYGIDFCCKGHRTLAEACEKKQISSAVLETEINAVMNMGNNQSIDFKSWPLDLLVDYIEKTHHRYVEEKSAVLRMYLDKLCKVHGGHHPELFEINTLFIEGSGELAKHMMKEELILFPFIKRMTQTKSDSISVPHFGTVDNPISMMQDEHTIEGERFAKIAELTNQYTPPADACETYKVTFAMLKEFEEDLHKHIHLENNILFPGAQVLEKQFTILDNLEHSLL
ncbi:iron-sulfur cluster repair di-iron protein [Flavobacterium phycosphaerae]|uniref:iron-sulfur cluster repair di-iron protein n=1 Tax=Flavobacterium phycosphaerae TaxID=2697515 RepID=UPI00138969C1|nr:iron-sulfur cluster repair di-iron protein [Flavobacterium phycosphaerae]